jgi:hypothetical protein
MQQIPLLKRAAEVLDAVPISIDSGFGESAHPAAKAATPADCVTDED